MSELNTEAQTLRILLTDPTATMMGQMTHRLKREDGTWNAALPDPLQAEPLIYKSNQKVRLGRLRTELDGP